MTHSSGISRSFRLRLLFIIILCLVFGLWGLYDLVVSIPKQQQIFDRFQSVQLRLTELEELRQQRQQQGQGMTQVELDEYTQLDLELNQLTPNGENPVPPGKFDPLTQWFFILCLPFVPYYGLKLSKARAIIYRIDEDGTLHLPEPEGTWKPQDIVDIDMSQWMKKSIAHVIHADGSRAKLDDYVYDKLFLIVGAIAYRLYPDQWDEQARDMKKTTPADQAESADADSDGENIDSEARES